VSREAVASALDGAHRIIASDGVLVQGAALPEELGPEALGELYGWMASQRVFDRAMLRLVEEGRLASYPAGIGQEGAVFGSGWALNAQDWLFPSLREHGLWRMRGATLDAVVAQAFGNTFDRSKGRQPPGHVGAPDQRVASTSPPLATHLLHAVGTARAIEREGSNAVVVVYLGAAATCEGDFHAACQHAASARLPVIFVCVRNAGTLGTPLSSRTRAATVADRLRPYAVEAVRVDGADVAACFGATRDAVARARGGGGPSFVEAVTWRIDRLDDASPEWRAFDPVQRLEAFLVRQGWIEAEALREVEAAAAAEVDEVIAIMAAQERPDAATLYEDAPSNWPRPLTDGR